MIPFNFSEIMRKRQGVDPAVPPDASAVKRPPVALPEAPARTVPLAPPSARPPQGGAQRPSYDQNSQIRDYRNNRVTDEVDFARDQYVREGQGEDGKVKRNWKTVLLNSLLGAGMGAAGGGGLGGAIGGAAAAGLGSTFNPMAGREFTFNRVQAPSMYQQMERERENRQADQAEEYRAAQIGDLAARAGERTEDREYERQVREAALARLPIEQQQTDEKHQAQMALMEAQKKERESNVSLRQARAKAAELGKPQPVDLLDNDGVIRTYYAYPNGDIKPLGESGKAAIQENKDKNAMNRVRFQEGSRTGRAAMSQAGQNSRLDRRLAADGGATAPAAPKAAAPPRKATMQDVNDYAKSRGISPEEARRKFEAKGIVIR